MIEQVIHGILLALPNIALAGCAAVPCYNRNLVNNRCQEHYRADVAGGFTAK